MHHKNHANSSANHSNPQHHQPKKQDYPSGPAPQTRKSNLLSKIAGKFREKPATEEEVSQLRLNTVREELKTRKQIAKKRRPSRFGGFTETRPAPSYRRSSRYNENESFLFSNPKSEGGGFLDFGSGPSLSMFTGTSEKQRGKKNQKSGLEELF